VAKFLNFTDPLGLEWWPQGRWDGQNVWNVWNSFNHAGAT